MDRIIMDLMQEGKDVNEVLAMPFHFVMEILRDKNKPKQTKSLISAFGG